ncbi:uncharacterized protein LOC118348911 [Juglans regia]|uniref:Uncharacterized protein LOC118348911 n=1 Tax=Juglans regia TaxID=51240 RepID=A0A6P9EGG0_JUGRE|nr:uncharacterized protein LOC118348911 [Juglans regia]
MDFVEGLPISKGCFVIMVVVDRLSKYAHFMSLKHPFTAAQAALLFFNNVFKLHGLPKTIVSDRGSTFTSSFWKELFRLQGVNLSYSSTYHPQSDGQTEAVNKCLEHFLRSLSGDKPRLWTDWLSLAEWWYNSTFHTSTKMTPFEAVYGTPPIRLQAYIPGLTANQSVDQLLQTREQILATLKSNLSLAQDRMSNPDKLTWRCTEDGKFSVKSTYHLQGELVDRRRGQSSISSRYADLWTKIWKIKVSNAIKKFLWRAGLESIPTEQNMYKRKVVESPYCPICLAEPETAIHTLWSCRAAKDVWGSCSRRLQKCGMEGSTFQQLLTQFFSSKPAEVLEEIAITAYHVWKRRNYFVFEGKFISPITICDQSLNALDDYKNFVKQPPIRKANNSAMIQTWEAPPPNTFKVNLDAAIDKIKCKVGVGVIIRDCEGKVIASLRSSRGLFLDAQLGEAVAVLKATSLCVNLELRQVVFEGDALSIVKAVNSPAEKWSSDGMITRDVKCMLQKFDKWSVRNVTRGINFVAHELARNATPIIGGVY